LLLYGRDVGLPQRGPESLAATGLDRRGKALGCLLWLVQRGLFAVGCFPEVHCGGGCRPHFVQCGEGPGRWGGWRAVPWAGLDGVQCRGACPAVVHVQQTATAAATPHEPGARPGHCDATRGCWRSARCRPPEMVWHCCCPWQRWL